MVPPSLADISEGGRPGRLALPAAARQGICPRFQELTGS